MIWRPARASPRPAPLDAIERLPHSQPKTIVAIRRIRVHAGPGPPPRLCPCRAYAARRRLFRLTRPGTPAIWPDSCPVRSVSSHGISASSQGRRRAALRIRRTLPTRIPVGSAIDDGSTDEQRRDWSSCHGWRRWDHKKHRCRSQRGDGVFSRAGFRRRGTPMSVEASSSTR